MTRTVDMIAKKRDGGELTSREIEHLIQGYTAGDIPDYQMSALTMAIYFRGMTDRERADLTLAMAASGDRIDLSAIAGVKVDKHSTGGVGDSTTLVLAPLVAAVGVPVAKMSGRGLGHTGGTVDKLASIPGFQAEISNLQFLDLVNRNGLAVVGQSGNLTPADKKLYALRDVTATVESIPLIASSIMSKKIAAGADAIVLDVKTGNGAFMKELADARELARSMVGIGQLVGKKTVAVISDMSQPLGYAVGNALEVKEAIDTLRGEGPADLTELCLVLGSQMVVLAGKAANSSEARRLLEDAVSSGQALAVFRRFVAAQGGQAAVVEHPELLPKAAYRMEVAARRSGYVSKLAAEPIGMAAMKLGAGRATKDDVIDLAVGIVLCKKVGDYVRQGEPLAVLHANRQDVRDIMNQLQDAIAISDETVQAPVLIRDMIAG